MFKFSVVAISSTPGFSPVGAIRQRRNRFNGFLVRQPLKRLASHWRFTHPAEAWC